MQESAFLMDIDLSVVTAITAGLVAAMCGLAGRLECSDAEENEEKATRQKDQFPGDQ